MSQEYTVKSWTVWQQEGEKVRDTHGNYKGSVTFEEANGEPVDATFKAEPKVGDKKYGDIVDYETKSGKTRTKFQRADRPKESEGSVDWDARQKDIRAQFAIKAAVELLKNPEADVAEDVIEHWAVVFYNMVDRVKTAEAKEDKPKDKVVEVDDSKEFDLNDIPF